MRKSVFITLVVISLFFLIFKFGSTPLTELLGLNSNAGLRIEATTPAKVFLDKKEVGSVPFQKENLSQGEHLIELKGDNGNWSGYVKLYSGTLAVVNRELAKVEASSSGEVITLSPGNGATITSNPSSSDVEVDGKMVGQTPLSVSNLAEGKHLFLISHSNYLKRSLGAVYNSGYSLNINVDLALSEADLTQVSAPLIKESPKVKVLPTPTGFLRVRDSASTAGTEIGRVNSGDTLILIEEQPSWDKVKLADDREGWVFSSYVEKISQ